MSPGCTDFTVSQGQDFTQYRISEGKKKNFSHASPVQIAISVDFLSIG